MNSQKTKSILLFALLLVLAGFKGKNGTDADFRIKKISSFTRPQDSSAFTYTPDGRIASHHSYLPTMWQSFEYSRNLVIEEGGGPSGTRTYKNTFYLNAKGIVDSMVRIADAQVICTYFKYDKNGYLTEESSGCDTQVVEMKRVIEKGNILKQVFYEKGTPYETVYFEYYNTPNLPTMFGIETMGHTYRGKDSKNLLKKVAIVEIGGDTVIVNNLHYQFDNLGRVSTASVYGKEGNLADSTAYGY